MIQTRMWPTFFILFGVMVATITAQSSLQIRSTAGVVAGVISSDQSVVSYKGIPYAEPPVGRLRWRAPEPLKPWTGVLKADHFGASCMQGPNNEFGPWTREFLYVTPPDENCLFLNIWTPKTNGVALRPVLVFIHGGAFTGGSGDVPVYDGEALAQTGMVVVTINYRLGVFGFLAHPELTAESAHHSSGNYGLLDQIAALEWVKKNIQGFGGDPSHVAIAGQSAGAMSVEDLLASPLTKGLFAAAIADSGIGGRGGPVRLLAEAEQSGVEFAKSLDAKSLAELRAMPAEKLQSKQMPMARYSPVVDGWLLPDAPIKITTERGNDNDVPVITGYQEGDARMGPPSASAEEFRTRARQIYGTMADEFLKLYPASSDAEANISETASGRDRLRAGLYLWSSRRAASHMSPVFAYTFDRAIPWPAHPEFGAFHTGEIPYVFGTLSKLERPWEAVDHQVSKMMMSYWKQMAATGNPNGDTTPHWAPIDPTNAQIMRLGAVSEPIAPVEATRYEFWKRYFESPVSEHASPF